MAAKIRAGTLRHKITIQRKVTVLDDTNAPSDVWTNIAVTRASMNPVKGDEFFISKSMIGEVDYYLIMRKRDLKANDRIVAADGRIFDIKSVLNNNERGVEILVYAKFRVGEIVLFDLGKLDFSNEDNSQYIGVL